MTLELSRDPRAVYSSGNGIPGEVREGKMAFVDSVLVPLPVSYNKFNDLAGISQRPCNAGPPAAIQAGSDTP